MGRVREFGRDLAGSERAGKTCLGAGIQARGWRRDRPSVTWTAKGVFWERKLKLVL